MNIHRILALVTTCSLLYQAAGAEVVLLRNGNLLEGRVEVLGNYVLVDTGTSELRIPRQDVGEVVASRNAAYEKHRRAMAHPSAAKHVALADWCLRNDMWPQAARELNDARMRDPRHPGVAMLESRLKVAVQAANRPASQSQPTAEEASPTPPTPGRDLEELEDIARKLDPEAIEQFTRHIQPILVNGCAAVACHGGPSGGELQLNRDLVRGMANRRSTLSNLAATLDQVNRDAAAESPLLTVPAAAHANLSGPVFRGRHAGLQEKLEAWVKQLNGEVDPPAPEQVLPAGYIDATRDRLAPITPAMEAEIEREVEAELKSKGMLKQEDAHFWEMPGRGEVKTAPTIIDGPEPIKDEFDPEIFNRQHGGQPASGQSLNALPQ